jgi:hypothetical protein
MEEGVLPDDDAVHLLEQSAKGTAALGDLLSDLFDIKLGDSHDAHSNHDARHSSVAGTIRGGQSSPTTDATQAGVRSRQPDADVARLKHRSAGPAGFAGQD